MTGWKWCLELIQGIQIQGKLDESGARVEIGVYKCEFRK